MSIAQEVAKNLLQINAVKLSPQNPFTWASGIKSPIYCDNRITLSYPSVRDFIIQAFVEKAQKFEPFDIVAGVATAGIPHGALIADRMKKPFIYIREKAKSHGRQNQIEGIIHEGAKVLVIEDLISTGGSSIKAVEAAREAGCEVVGVLAIFSYGFEKAERMSVITSASEQFLYTYLNNASPTGFEASGQKLWLEYIRPFIDEWHLDNYGTAYAVINPGKPYRVVIEGHADEISWFVNYITDDGFINVIRNGGSDQVIAPSKRVNIHTKKGIVKGVFGWPAIHVRTGKDANLMPEIANIFIDIGAKNKEEVANMGVHRQAASRTTGTDTDAFAYSNGGVVSALISLPLRYMHTTVEMAHKEDIENVIRLMYETLQKIEAHHNFKYF
ncbi:hypothetical protein GHT06_007052 [Daphnia sinensis]|uniref:orotate phosphoribosyltransferase n=1 Tax=Daphnia sinensis TaxID=1820382 RepID=A0AAD5L554_9CRUS|nr:hypothetical protein GHT06_007052 [Daphnia sinensis]